MVRRKTSWHMRVSSLMKNLSTRFHLTVAMVAYGYNVSFSKNSVKRTRQSEFSKKNSKKRTKQLKLCDENAKRVSTL